MELVDSESAGLEEFGATRIFNGFESLLIPGGRPDSMEFAISQACRLSKERPVRICSFFFYREDNLFWQLNPHGRESGGGTEDWSAPQSLAFRFPPPMRSALLPVCLLSLDEISQYPSSCFPCVLHRRSPDVSLILLLRKGATIWHQISGGVERVAMRSEKTIKNKDCSWRERRSKSMLLKTLQDMSRRLPLIVYEQNTSPKASGTDAHGIAVTRPLTNIPLQERFIQFHLENSSSEVIIVIINTENVYVVGYLFRPASRLTLYYLDDIPREELFQAFPSRQYNYSPLGFAVNYRSLPDREKIELGHGALNDAIRNLYYRHSQPSALLVIIQMVSEAARISAGTIMNPRSGLVIAAESSTQRTVLNVAEDNNSSRQAWSANTQPTINYISGFREMCLQANGAYACVWLANCVIGTEPRQQWALYGDSNIRLYSDRTLCVTSNGHESSDSIFLLKGQGSGDERWTFMVDGSPTSPKLACVSSNGIQFPYNVVIFHAILLPIFFLFRSKKHSHRLPPGSLGYSKIYDPTKYSNRLPPGSLGVPVIGQSLDLLKALKNDKVEEWFHKGIAKNGPIWKASLFGYSTVVVHGPSANKFIYTFDGNVVTSTQPPSISRIIGSKNVFELSGHDHKRVRAALVSFLKLDVLKQYVTKIDEEIQYHLQTHWHGKNEIQVQPLIKTLTFNIICSLLFGIERGPKREKFLPLFQDMIEGILAIPINLPFTQFNRGIRARKKMVPMLMDLIHEKRDVLEKQKHLASPNHFIP
uniref:Ribosome-inactivating protein n=1 Tax=Tanacetum cinerariifolium TaxID=118510 RepID=A0A6L2J485_TANCI|nr:cytochrome P450 716B1-like [Tanacetum cinerariifolium]